MGGDVHAAARGALVTVGVMLRVPGHGAVLACDSRTACMSTGMIYSDTDQKWGDFGGLVAVCAGALGGLWLDLRSDPPRNVRELRKKITNIEAADNERNYEVLAFDRASDSIHHLDESGDATAFDRHATIGCGGPIALGVLDAARAPQTLDAAAKLARRAVAIACRRNVFCGGRIRTVVVPRRGNVSIR
jgi:hypothetical protein